MNIAFVTEFDFKSNRFYLNKDIIMSKSSY